MHRRQRKNPTRKWFQIVRATISVNIPQRTATESHTALLSLPQQWQATSLFIIYLTKTQQSRKCDKKLTSPIPHTAVKI